ncbi:unnamed protein product [Schistocephalus solidus]|uniref:Uncharacterized protein n=1 Tax=Schistocephalus solidus TaxID=70667 RepID=A0A183SHP9_SCHSO|nr:unnamed protein product [Schistocephalus solidus]
MFWEMAKAYCFNREAGRAKAAESPMCFHDTTSILAGHEAYESSGYWHPPPPPSPPPSSSCLSLPVIILFLILIPSYPASLLFPLSSSSSVSACSSDTWLTLRTEQMACGYQQLLPPQGYTIPDLQATWRQLDMAEHVLRALIQEKLCERAHKERLMATFNRKVKLHQRWLAENGKLAMVLCVADRTNLNFTLQKLCSLSNRGTNSNLLSFLLQEREKLLALQCKHRTMMADTEAHNSERFRTLQEVRQQICQLDDENDHLEECLSRLHRSWVNLSSILFGRTEFIESSVSMIGSIIDVEKVLMELEISWGRLVARFLRAADSEVHFTDGEILSLHGITSGSWRRVRKALHSVRSEKTSGLPGFLSQKLFARFLALNLPMESLLLFFEGHSNNLNHLKQRTSMLTDRLQRTKEQRQYLQALIRMTELTFGELQNDNHESIRIISSKFRLIENEIRSEVFKEADFADCPLCANLPFETKYPTLNLTSKVPNMSFDNKGVDQSFWELKNCPARRPHSMEQLSREAGDDRVQLRRTMTFEEIQEPYVLPEEVAEKQTFLLRVKQLAREDLERLGCSFHETHLLLMTEMAEFLKEIEQYKAFTSVFLELAELRIELEEGKTWVCQTLDYFSRTQLPAIRSALATADIAFSDVSLESVSSMFGWWKQLIQTNKLFKIIILYQSTIRREKQALDQPRRGGHYSRYAPRKMEAHAAPATCALSHLRST